MGEVECGIVNVFGIDVRVDRYGGCVGGICRGELGGARVPRQDQGEGDAGGSETSPGSTETEFVGDVEAGRTQATALSGAATGKDDVAVVAAHGKPGACMPVGDGTLFGLSEANLF